VIPQRDLRLTMLHSTGLDRLRLRPVALYERGSDGIDVPPGHDAPLTDRAVLAVVRRVALNHGLVVLPLP